ncbi:hypothetical protein EHQ53_14215 [Leptospira langatensis]|uniref:Uncharacterized protein n=1 Tax=Leptospira langatensis TaxID=2484983 RepID=A0ABY2M9B1_9LEPT|nr:hypothetical protein [Leptospira langatensis]TGL39672.1 hypothetical protein EHQ53_14215 [Leptospira langatensis]
MGFDFEVLEIKMYKWKDRKPGDETRILVQSGEIYFVLTAKENYFQNGDLILVDDEGMAIEIDEESARWGFLV